MLSRFKLSHFTVTSCSSDVESENRPRPLKRHNVIAVRRARSVTAQGVLGNVGETYTGRFTDLPSIIQLNSDLSTFSYEKVVNATNIFYKTWFSYRFSNIHTHTDIKRTLLIRYFMFVNVLLMRHDAILCMPSDLYYLDEFVLWPPDNIFSHEKTISHTLRVIQKL